MKVQFQSGLKSLLLIVDAHFAKGKLINLTPKIRFHNHEFTTKDEWEIQQVRKWMKNHPEDRIKEIK